MIGVDIKGVDAHVYAVSYDNELNYVPVVTHGVTDGRTFLILK